MSTKTHAQVAATDADTFTVMDEGIEKIESVIGRLDHGPGLEAISDDVAMVLTKFGDFLTAYGTLKAGKENE